MKYDTDERRPTDYTMPLAFTISDLRQRPEFFDSVADRIWQAWWRADGHPLEYISGCLRENLSAAAIPFALVAHGGAGVEAGNISRSPP